MEPIKTPIPIRRSAKAIRNNVRALIEAAAHEQDAPVELAAPESTPQPADTRQSLTLSEYADEVQVDIEVVRRWCIAHENGNEAGLASSHFGEELDESKIRRRNRRVHIKDWKRFKASRRRQDNQHERAVKRSIEIVPSEWPISARAIEAVRGLSPSAAAFAEDRPAPAAQAHAPDWMRCPQCDSPFTRLSVTGRPLRKYLFNHLRKNHGCSAEEADKAVTVAIESTPTDNPSMPDEQILTLKEVAAPVSGS